VADGVVASMGTVILLAGHRIECTDHSKLMTHRPTGRAQGDFQDMRDRADQNEAIYKEVGAIYAASMGKPIQEVMDMLMPKGRDMWWTAKQAKEMGLVQEVTKGSALRGTVAVRELRKVRDPNEILSRFAACLQEDEVELDTNNTTMKETAKKLGLPETATEAEVNAALDKLMAEKNTAVADLTKFKEAAEKQQEEDLKAILDEAVKGNSMTVAERDQMLSSAKGNVMAVLNTARVLVKGLKPHVDASAMLRKGADQAAGGEDSKYAGWSYKDYLDKDPIALGKLRSKDAAAFTKLKNDYLEQRRNG
ncbi:MAG TPA: ATP-dependent Clp protease proteolytic subunit, partial [Flavobacteriales bacterium]|nr:ATP-dependent Clp protease proteolytic subunit [Flavobacteriales bacterium]